MKKLVLLLPALLCTALFAKDTELPETERCPLTSPQQEQLSKASHNSTHYGNNAALSQRVGTHIHQHVENVHVQGSIVMVAGSTQLPAGLEEEKGKTQETAKENDELLQAPKDNSSPKASTWTPQFYAPSRDGMTPQMRHAVKEVTRLNLKGDENILDAGCGNGDTDAYIARYFVPDGSIHGIDISPSMIETAEKNHGSSHVTFEQASLINYQSTETYDAVVCFWTLYLVDDYQAALQSLVQSVKPGGKILVCHLMHPGTTFCTLLEKYIAPQKMPFTFPTLETIQESIKAVPATVEYFNVQVNYEPFPTIEDFLNAKKKLPFYSLLPQEKQAAFEEEFYATQFVRKNGLVYDFGHAVCYVLKRTE